MTQQALIYPAKHAAFELGSRAIPTPGKNEVLVKLEAIGLNPADWKIRDYGILVENFLAVLGIDGAGVIASVGADVTIFKKGDRVFFQGSYGGGADYCTFQEYSLAESDILSRIPPKISTVSAVSVPVTSITSLMCLYHTTGASLPPFWKSPKEGHGKSILIVGGSTSCGQFAIQFARLSGFTNIIVTAGPKHEQLVTGLGATHIIDRAKTQDEQIREIQVISKGNLEVAVDTIGNADTQFIGYSALSKGVLASTGHINAKIKDAGKDVLVKSIFGSSHVHRDLAREYWGVIEGYLDRGEIVPNKVRVLVGLDKIVEGLDMLKKGTNSGEKIVVQVLEKPQELTCLQKLLNIGLLAYCRCVVGN